MKTTTIFLLMFIFLSFAAGKVIYSQNTDNADLIPIEELGKNLFFDKIADPDNMSCADCHGPAVGYTGPNPAINKKGSVYKGAVRQRFGNRKPPSAAYATFSPVFHYDETEGLFIGGNFWDGRATGELLGNPAADQAQGPFLNPVEHNNASKEDVLEQIANSNYADLWEEVWGDPISYETEQDINENYDRVGLTLAAYENSSEVNPFSSKYDYYLKGMVELTEEEEWGLELFNGTGKCVLCHPSTLENGMPPLFTDFTFDNLGTPKNPENPFYDMDEVYLPNGDPINPLGDAWIDKGLGGFLLSRPEYADKAADNMGKHKVPTLRNVDKRPGNGFTKAYLHNGVFKSLKEVVHFYNTRDIKVWPPPEVAANINDDELGNLGLTDEEEDAIVVFMKTLSDDYKLRKSSPFTNTNVFTEIELEIGPNPFVSTSNISFSLPQPNKVELYVYDLSGRKVKTLINEWLGQGNNMVIMDSKGLENGIYLVALKIGDQVKTKKVTLTR